MNNLYLILSTLIFTAFFAGIELAFVSSNKFRIELDNAQGRFSARILSFFTKSPSRFIITALIGINISLVIYSNSIETVLEPYVLTYLPLQYHNSFIILAIKTILSTAIILIAGEFLPKVLFRINPNQSLNFFATIFYVFYILFYPLVFLILKLSHLIMQVFFKLDFVEDKPVFGRIDLDHYIHELNVKSNQKNELNTEIQMFQNALDFDRLKARECMVPRADIVAIDINADIETLRQLFVSTGLSKILVYQQSIDYIVGFVHSFDMFKQPKSIKNMMLPIAVVPETMPARSIMTTLTQQRKSVCVVVDEHGVTSGLITVEDIMEEIFGEIDDEHDIEELTLKKISENEYQLSGRYEIDYLNTHLNLHIPEGDYTTLGGFIFYHHQDIPVINEVIEIAPFTITIDEVINNRINLVTLKTAFPET